MVLSSPPNPFAMEEGWPFQNEAHWGRGLIEVPPVTIRLPLESTYLSSSINMEFAERYYTAMFQGNRILRTLMVYVTNNPEHVEITKLGWGLDADLDGKAEKVLSQVFPREGVTFLRKRSCKPAHIGAIFKANRRLILFSFHIFRGALPSAGLESELERSIKVELAQ